MRNIFEQFLSSAPNLHTFIQFSNAIRAYQYQKPFTITSQYLSPQSSALDWGSGNGHLSAFLLHNQQKTTAFGFGETSFPTALTDNPLLTFIAADITEPTKLPFADNFFDLVLSMGVLEHVHESGGDQLASLQEIHRILAPSGMFLCFHFPHSGSWVEKLHKAILPFKKNKSYIHTKRFSRTDVRQLCHSSQLILKEWGTYNFFPRNFSQCIPPSIANNATLVTAFNKIDHTIATLLPYLCNQTYFIAQKNKP